MGKYRWSIYFVKQIGIMIGYDEEFIVLQLPFITINYGRGDTAKERNF